MMARKDVIHRRRQRAAGEWDKDRLSDLSDDLLLDIMRRVDTCTALGAAVLSRRWAHLPSELPTMDQVTDILPPRYHRLHLLRHDARKSKISLTLFDRRRLNSITGRYERHAMRALIRYVKGLLASGAHRRVERLSLEFFAYDTSACLNHLVVVAVDSWGVEAREVAATPTGPITFLKPPPYSFPCGIISGKPGESRLRSLKLANCLPPPLREFTMLTRLVLRDLPDTTPAATYEAVVAACPQLQVLHLVSCQFTSKTGRLVLDAPMSDIRELLLDGQLMVVELRSLPKLESLTSFGSKVVLCSTAAAPCLARVRMSFSVGRLEGDSFAGLHRLQLDFFIRVLVQFFQGAISVKDLVLRFTGPDMWIASNNNQICYFSVD